MSDELAYADRLIKRLEAAENRNQQISNHSITALEKLDKVLPVLSKRFKGDEAMMALIREVYSVLEEGAEESQSTITEIKEARDSLEITINMLKEAGYDFANIQQFSNPKIWLGSHLPTIKRALEIFDTQPAAEGEIPLFDQALDSLSKERFEDIAHAVKRSGEKRQNAADPDAAAAAALAAIDAIKVATDLLTPSEASKASPPTQEQ